MMSHRTQRLQSPSVLTRRFVRRSFSDCSESISNLHPFGATRVSLSSARARCRLVRACLLLRVERLVAFGGVPSVACQLPPGWRLSLGSLGSPPRRRARARGRRGREGHRHRCDRHRSITCRQQTHSDSKERPAAHGRIRRAADSWKRIRHSSGREGRMSCSQSLIVHDRLIDQPLVFLHSLLPAVDLPPAPSPLVDFLLRRPAHAAARSPVSMLGVAWRAWGRSQQDLVDRLKGQTTHRQTRQRHRSHAWRNRGSRFGLGFRCLCARSFRE
jgi:hypothetical protein